MPTLERAIASRRPTRVALGFAISLGVHLFGVVLWSEEPLPPARAGMERSLVILPRIEVVRARSASARASTRGSSIAAAEIVPAAVDWPDAATADSQVVAAGGLGAGGIGLGGVGTAGEGTAGAGEVGDGVEAVVRREPEAVHVVPADYPRAARRQKAKGLVWVRLRVDAAGRVVDAGVESSDTIEALERAALDAARRWRFRWVAQSETSTVVTHVPFRFELPK